MENAELERIITDEKERSRKLCEEALEDTPEQYRKFLTFITNNKKIGGTRDRPVYVQTQNPYMTVDGRVKMAMDDHRENGATIAIETYEEPSNIKDVLVYKAVVTSSLLGSATAHAQVFVNGVGANKSNPLESGETSAIGRALGYLGYGLYGTGIASSEEMLAALDAQSFQGYESQGGGSGGSQGQGQASERQLAFARDLLEKAGWREAQIEKRLTGKTRADISSLIEKLKNDPQGSKPAQTGSGGSPKEQHAAGEPEGEYEPEYANEDFTF